MTEEDIIKKIRMKIFELAKESIDLETMHWYMWLDECFENDKFHLEEVKNIQWRIWVLWEKKELVRHLTELIEELLKKYNLIDKNGKFTI